MKTDLFELATGDGRAGGAALDLFERARRIAVLADQSAFQCMWLAEHHFQPHGGVQSRPQLLIADLAARTERLQFGVGIFQVPFHPAISTAEDISTLSNLAPGRFRRGYGRAFFRNEHSAFGARMDTSMVCFRDRVLLIEQLLEDESVTHDSEWDRFDDVTLLPRPDSFAAPAPWIAAVTSPESFQWAGEQGFNLMVNPLLSADLDSLKEMVDIYRAAHGPEGEIMVNTHVHVADSRQASLNQAGPALEEYVRETRTQGAKANAEHLKGTPPKDFAGYPALASRWDDFTVEGALDRGVIAFGSPDEVTNKLTALGEALGASSVAAMFDFGQEFSAVERSVTLYAQHCLAAVEAHAA